MKFRYYIADLYEGRVVGTNNEEKATGLALSEEYFVIDSEAGGWLTADGVAIPVEEGYVRED